MALTDQQLQDFHADIGDADHAFTDDELHRLYERASNNYEKAIVMALDQLLSSAAKFNDYTQNASSEKRSQIFQQLTELRHIWQEKISANTRRTKQFAFAAIRRSTKIQEKPATLLEDGEQADA
jgi:hypothetical protein